VLSNMLAGSIFLKVVIEGGRSLGISKMSFILFAFAVSCLLPLIFYNS
jgi:hypothetical protein